MRSLAVHDMLVVTLGWSSDRYEAWLAARLIGLLLVDWGEPGRRP